MSAPDIFLSYNREDADVAQRFADAFAEAGLEVWWDVTLRSGEAYDQVTEEALESAKAVVVLWSPRSVVSRWVRAEATVAERNRTLMPATIEPCKRPVMFELTQTAELSHWRGEAGDAAWRDFLGDVQRRVGKDGPQSPTQSPPAPSPAGSGVPVVAVLPITHRGSDDLTFLAEDLTEDTTRALSLNSYFEVIAASTMAASRGKPIDNRAVAQELRARYLVESKLRASGENVRLDVQVIDAEAGKMVWSQRYARKAGQIETSPEEVAEAVASELAQNIFSVEINRAMARSGPFSGWEHMMRSHAYSMRLGSDALQRGIEEARLAVSAAPDLGWAHATLATMLAVRLSYAGEELDDAMRQEIRSHITRAMQLDGDNPKVIGQLAVAYGAIGDGKAALRLARRLEELEPYSFPTYLYLGYANMIAGHLAEARPALEKALSLSSTDTLRYATLMHLGVISLLEGDPAEAADALDRSLALHPEYYNTLKWRAVLAAELGDEEDARATIRKLRENEPGMSIDNHVRQIMIYAGLADRLAKPIATLRRLWDETEGAG